MPQIYFFGLAFLSTSSNPTLSHYHVSKLYHTRIASVTLIGLMEETKSNNQFAPAIQLWIISIYHTYSNMVEVHDTKRQLNQQLRLA